MKTITATQARKTAAQPATLAASERTFQPGDALLKDVLAHFPQIILAVLFGSVALGRQRPDSDLDLAVAAAQALTANEKIAIIGVLAESTGRPIDLIDLKTVSEPLLGQVVRHGRRILGSDTHYGALINRHLLEQADFMPYRSRVLAERRKAWIGK
ncbi:MAG: nucleotidyltransferase domain-containing protein [Oxalobacteraceae bacterium]